MSEKGKSGITIKPWQLAVIILAVLALVGGGIYVGIRWNDWFGDSPASQTGKPDIDPGAQDWTGDLPNQNEESGETKGIQIPGYPSIPIPAGKKDIQIALLNPKGNPCYFTFELVLDETGETLYTSKQVPPGKAITSQTLKKALSAGTYNATIKITTASLEDQSAMNGANVKTQLIVK